MLRIKKYLLFTILFWEISFSSFSQFEKGKNFGVSFGANIAVGNRFHRMGLVFQGYYFYNFVQVNAELRVYHSLKNLGPKIEYNEAVASAGLVLAYGKKQNYFKATPLIFCRLHYNNIKLQ